MSIKKGHFDAFVILEEQSNELKIFLQRLKSLDIHKSDSKRKRRQVLGLKIQGFRHSQKSSPPSD